VQLSDTPCRAPGVVSRLLDGEAVLIHPAQGKVRVLNGVGARIWELADGRHSIGAMARLLAQEYEVGLSQAGSDVLAFCHDLSGRGLLN